MEQRSRYDRQEYGRRPHSRAASRRIAVNESAYLKLDMHLGNALEELNRAKWAANQAAVPNDSDTAHGISLVEELVESVVQVLEFWEEVHSLQR